MKTAWTKPVVLVDVDEVLANFVQSALEEIRRITGRTYVRSDIRSWDIAQSLGLIDEERVAFETAIRKRYFCTTMPAYAGIADALSDLREVADVHALTTPLSDAPFWMAERTDWLEAHGFDHKHITFSGAKHLVGGDYLVEDRLSNLEAWWVAHPNNVPVLIMQPWNASSTYAGWRQISFPEAVQVIVRDINDRYVRHLLNEYAKLEAKLSSAQLTHMRHAQRISFVAGNMALSNTSLTLEAWHKLAAKHTGPCPCGEC